MLNLFIFIFALASFALLYFLKSMKRKAFEKELPEILNRIDAFNMKINEVSQEYIPLSTVHEIQGEWQVFFRKLKNTRIPRNHPCRNQVGYFIKFFSNFEENVQSLNREFIIKEEEKHKTFFSNLEKPLGPQQKDVVLSDNDSTLVLAGAGSGKTLVIATKVRYLCQEKGVSPDEILLISFTKKAAGEMTDRVNKYQIPIEATTFHKLGLDIISYANGRKPNIETEGGLSDFICDFFDKNLVNNRSLTKSMIEFFAYYIDIPENFKRESVDKIYNEEKKDTLNSLDNANKKNEYIDSIYLQRMASCNTLTGDRVRSLEEVKIANFLFLNGVRYEYERPYPFDSGSETRRQYCPDFYLTDYDIYLEHFGVNRDFRLPQYSKKEEKEYLEGMEWKRNFHKLHKTKLIETYSFFIKDGTLEEKLTKLLKENGVLMKEPDFNELFHKIYEDRTERYFQNFVKLCSTFISLFKSANNGPDDFRQMRSRAARSGTIFMEKRSLLFLDIIEAIYNEYQKNLKAKNMIDFSDMINLAAEIVQTGALEKKIVENQSGGGQTGGGIAQIKRNGFKYVIIDEYQDISNARYHLIKAIVDKTDAKLLCVGDDWQSIYRFAGSDIALFTDFKNYFANSCVMKIETTFRNSQELVDLARDFIMKNPKQLDKYPKSNKSLKEPLQFRYYKNDKDFIQVLSAVIDEIILEFEKNEKKGSIALLGRTKFDINKVCLSSDFDVSHDGNKIRYLPSPETKIEFLTVHKSKGLEADYVIILNFKNHKQGFPCQIEDDDVLKYVLTQPEPYPFAEERRLFYVAITRTRNKTYVLVDKKHPSIFLNDFTV